MAATTRPATPAGGNRGNRRRRPRHSVQVIDPRHRVARGQIVLAAHELETAPLQANSGLSTNGPCAASRRTIARALSRDSTAQVSGVGIPARASRSWSSICRRSARSRARRSRPGRRSRARRGGCRAAASPPGTSRPTSCARTRRLEAIAEAGDAQSGWALCVDGARAQADRVRAHAERRKGLREHAPVPVDPLDREGDERRSCRGLGGRRATRRRHREASGPRARDGSFRRCRWRSRSPRPG